MANLWVLDMLFFMVIRVFEGEPKGLYISNYSIVTTKQGGFENDEIPNR